MTASEWFLIAPCIAGIALLLWRCRYGIRDFFDLLKWLNEPVWILPKGGEDHLYVDSTPWEMLAAPVTLDGEGYYIQSPAGGRVRITNEQRQFIVDAVKFYQQHKENV